MLPFIEFGTLNMKMAMKIISYIFHEKLTKARYSGLTHHHCDILNTDGLALINCAPLHHHLYTSTGESPVTIQQ
jgi:hypothetical protein